MNAVSTTVVLLALIAGPVTIASAMPVVATLQGCVSASALPELVEWTGSTHLLLGSFHDPTAGCEPTVFAPSPILEQLETEDAFTVLLHKERLDPSCGRYQFDVESWDDSLSMVSLVVDFGDNCAPSEEIILTEGSGESGGTGTLPKTAQQQVAVPEPATVLLMGLGLAVAWRTRRRES